MSHVKHIDPLLPDFRPLLHNLRPPPDPNRQPLLELTPLTVPIQTTATILILFLSEVFNFGSELFQLGSMPCIRVLVNVLTRALATVFVVVLRLLETEGWVLWFGSVILELWVRLFFWIVRRASWMYGRVLRRVWIKLCERVGGCLCRNLGYGYEGYSKIQEWEPPRSETPETEIAVTPDPLDWFSGHPIPCEAYPTPTSRRQWSFSY